MATSRVFQVGRDTVSTWKSYQEIDCNNTPLINVVSNIKNSNNKNLSDTSALRDDVSIFKFAYQNSNYGYEVGGVFHAF